MTVPDREPVACKACGEDTDPLDVFPGGRCLECWKKTPEANRLVTADELRSMWGAPTRRRRR